VLKDLATDDLGFMVTRDEHVLSALKREIADSDSPIPAWRRARVRDTPAQTRAVRGRPGVSGALRTLGQRTHRTPRRWCQEPAGAYHPVQHRSRRCRHRPQGLGHRE
jgi:hypothetical protein